MERPLPQKEQSPGRIPGAMNITTSHQAKTDPMIS